MVGTEVWEVESGSKPKPKSKKPIPNSEHTNVAGRNTMVKMVMAFMVLLSEREDRASRIMVRVSVAEMVESILLGSVSSIDGSNGQGRGNKDGEEGGEEEELTTRLCTVSLLSRAFSCSSVHSATLAFRSREARIWSLWLWMARQSGLVLSVIKVATLSISAKIQRDSWSWKVKQCLAMAIVASWMCTSRFKKAYSDTLARAREPKLCKAVPERDSRWQSCLSMSLR